MIRVALILTLIYIASLAWAPLTAQANHHGYQTILAWISH